MLKDQPTDRTNRKVKYASWTAAWVAPLATVLGGVTAEFLPGDLSRFELEFALLMTFAITGIGTWVVGYRTRERA
jgi:hypothetical protein